MFLRSNASGRRPAAIPASQGHIHPDMLQEVCSPGLFSNQASTCHKPSPLGHFRACSISRCRGKVPFAVVVGMIWVSQKGQVLSAWDKIHHVTLHHPARKIGGAYFQKEGGYKKNKHNRAHLVGNQSSVAGSAKNNVTLRKAEEMARSESNPEGSKRNTEEMGTLTAERVSPQLSRRTRQVRRDIHISFAGLGRR
ncbi:hypothetical protein NL676_009456 [Syzygium grande]|nr:hypothetical protein NL676_009456 [Syzygium grande]